jgi:cysteinyl-tRNA synthetase
VPADVAELVRQRDDARADRDFTTADRLRDQLGELGWDVVDGPGGSMVGRRS